MKQLRSVINFIYLFLFYRYTYNIMRLWDITKWVISDKNMLLWSYNNNLNKISILNTSYNCSGLVLFLLGMNNLIFNEIIYINVI